ncbi:MAG TPA: hypothetical protein VF177_16595 [Anaerolineae bacterium]
MSESEQPKRSYQELIANNRVALVLAAVAAVALIAVCVLGILLLQASRDGGLVAGETPTPFPTAAQAPASNEPLVVGMDLNRSSTVSVTLDIPATLSVAGKDFSVQPQTIAPDGAWSPSLEGEDVAVWIYGTIVNYILGLPDSEENRTLLEQLAPGDEIVLTMRSGTEYTFTFDSRNSLSTSNRDVFAQNMPGITLILLGTEGQERLVVHGRYVVSEATAENDNVVELGETAQLDNIQIAVTGASYLPDRPETPPGFALYQIDYQVQNVGLTAFDTGNLQMILIDDLGNQYATNQLASQLGNNPVLDGFVNAGQTVQATAGYQIPIGLSSSSLHWVVTRTDTGSQVQVNIPFTEQGGATQGVDISLDRADVSPDLTNLQLGGQITNLGTQPVVVTEQDISLSTDDGSVYPILSTNPAFPWTVPPGETAQFFLTFQRPPADSAVFTVLNRPFQLSGLR